MPGPSKQSGNAAGEQARDAERTRIADMLGIPDTVSVEIEKFELVKEIDLWTLPHIRELMEYQDENMKPFLWLDLYEISYRADYRVKESDCELTANTFLLVPKQLIQNPAETVPLTYISGSIQGMDAFLPPAYFEDPQEFMRNSIEALGVFFHAYYLQTPVHIICKRGPEIIENFSRANVQDVLGRQWTSDHCARQAALEVLQKLKIPVSKEKGFVGGISAGGFRTLLLSAFDDEVTHAFSVAGIFSFRSFVSPEGESLNSYYGRADLLEKNIDTGDFIALGRARTVALFSMSDNEVRPRHFGVLKQANEKRRRYGLEPIRLQVFHLEPGRRGHSWPRIEAINFFGNALFED